jgi:hypothetical protein
LAKSLINEGVLGWSALHKKKGLDCGVVDIPIAVRMGFKSRIRGCKRAVKVEIKSRRKAQDADNMSAPLL